MPFQSKMKSPFFSIGVTTYNRREMLKECLDSILAQTFTDFEVTVGNDYTEDNMSPEQFGINDPRIRIVNHERNLGEINNMNFLLMMSCGRYFTWLADDDLYTPDFLRRIYETLGRFNFPLCVFTSYRIIGSNYSRNSQACQVGGSLLLTGCQFLRKYLERSVKLLGCCGVFDSHYLRKTGGIEVLGNGFSPYSDNALAIRAALLDKVAYIETPLILYRIHGGSISCSSKDIDAYSSAQESLIRECIDVFTSKTLRGDFEHNFFLLLKWFIKDFVSVVRRSESITKKQAFAYLIFLKRNVESLKNPFLIWIAVGYLIKEIIRQILSFVKTKLFRSLSRGFR